MKQEFIEFLDALMEAAPEVVAKKMTDDIKEYISVLKTEKNSKVVITDNGKVVLKFLQEQAQDKNASSFMKARDIAEQVGLTSRSVSGSLRKLVNDGFCDKMAGDPVLYQITEKGKQFNIEGE